MRKLYSPRIALGLAIVVMALVGYVLSCGPMFAHYTNDGITAKTYVRIYMPVLWLTENLGGVGLFNSYTGWWDRNFGGDGVPQSTYEDR